MENEQLKQEALASSPNDLAEKTVQSELTFGQRAVGLNFNPSNDSVVDYDLCSYYRNSNRPDVGR